MCYFNIYQCYRHLRKIKIPAISEFDSARLGSSNEENIIFSHLRQKKLSNIHWDRCGIESWASNPILAFVYSISHWHTIPEDLIHIYLPVAMNSNQRAILGSSCCFSSSQKSPPPPLPRVLNYYLSPLPLTSN